MTDPTIHQQLCLLSIFKTTDISANEAIDSKVNYLRLTLQGCYFTDVYLILVPAYFYCHIRGLGTMATSYQEIEQDGHSVVLHQIT